jgi:hypothetical protein
MATQKDQVACRNIRRSGVAEVQRQKRPHGLRTREHWLGASQPQSTLSGRASQTRLTGTAAVAHRRGMHPVPFTCSIGSVALLCATDACDSERCQAKGRPHREFPGWAKSRASRRAAGLAFEARLD